MINLIKVLEMNDENFCRFFLYSLLDSTIAEIRFDVHSDELNKSKLWALTNFVINIPLKLLNVLKEEVPCYSSMVDEYEEFSKRLGIYEWFKDLKEAKFEHYSKIPPTDSNKIV